MEIKEALLKLKEIEEFGESNVWGGICYLLSLMLNYDVYSFVKENCSDWEFFSGDCDYPVSGKEAFLYNNRHFDLWKGEQLELRLSLIDHLLSKC